MRSCSDSGQATVEAAILVPVTFLLLLVLCQPAILLFDRMAMASAAGQGVRMLSTMPQTASVDGYEEALRSQLEAVPDVEIFHVGDWDIELNGNEAAGEVSVVVSTEVEPLPLLGFAAGALGLLNSDGRFELSVEAKGDTQPSWVWAGGSSPSEWVDQWE